MSRNDHQNDPKKACFSDKNANADVIRSFDRLRLYSLLWSYTICPAKCPVCFCSHRGRIDHAASSDNWYYSPFRQFRFLKTGFVALYRKMIHCNGFKSPVHGRFGVRKLLFRPIWTLQAALSAPERLLKTWKMDSNARWSAKIQKWIQIRK